VSERHRAIERPLPLNQARSGTATDAHLQSGQEPGALRLLPDLQSRANLGRLAIHGFCRSNSEPECFHCGSAILESRIPQKWADHAACALLAETP
jgi:hypothetical protein